MNANETNQKGNPKDYGLSSHSDQDAQTITDAEAGLPNFESFLSNLIENNAFISEEVDELVGPEGTIGVARKFRSDGAQVLVNDRRNVTIAETAVLEEFTALFVDMTDSDTYVERVKNTRFEWNSKRDTEGFLKQLADLARTRLQNLREGNDSDRYLRSKGLNNADDLYKAADYFREMARQRGVKDALKKQFNALPIKAFQGLTTDGELEEIDRSEIDYILKKNNDGEMELLIFCKNKRYVKIRPVYYPADEAEDENLFARSEGSGEEPTAMKGKKPEDDLTHYELHVDAGSAPVQPLFGTVRVFTKPRDLQKDLREYEEEQDDWRSTLPGMPRKKAGSGYTPTAPSYPSSNNWSQPTTYVSSG